jgi:phosphoribosylformylglycinamidine cyclo-ligase
LHFIEGLHVIKETLLPVPPLFKMIQEESKTEWSEMYRVFNMGHRLEIYTDAVSAERMIELARTFHIDAQVVGRVEASDRKMLTIRSQHGEFIYES